nr:zinc finger protein 467-like [Dermacentor andersoni]
MHRQSSMIAVSVGSGACRRCLHRWCPVSVAAIAENEKQNAHFSPGSNPGLLRGSSLPLGCLEQNQSLMSVRGSLHSCRLCPYVTASKACMKRHLRTHTGERPFKCHLCPNTFALKSNLTRHVRTHTNERCYQCHLCPETFTDGTALKRHGRCHTGERLFPCVHCSASFSRKRHLNIHMLCHAVKKP